MNTFIFKLRKANISESHGQFDEAEELAWDAAEYILELKGKESINDFFEIPEEMLTPHTIAGLSSALMVARGALPPILPLFEKWISLPGVQSNLEFIEFLNNRIKVLKSNESQTIKI